MSESNVVDLTVDECQKSTNQFLYSLGLTNLPRTSEESEGSYLDSNDAMPPSPTSGSPIPPPEPTELCDAIASASSEKTTAFFLRICDANGEARRITSDEFLAPVAATNTTLGKRKPLETCKYCKAEYAVGENSKKSCRYHPGSSTQRKGIMRNSWRVD